MKTSPLVSICIPVFNGSNYIREAIDSALAQTYPNIEILVINDGSNDDGATRDIAMGYDERIRYFEKENGGVSTALNFAIRNMKGEWFSWLSHDDLFLPDKIQNQLECYEKYKAEFIYSDYKFIDEKGNVLNKNTEVVSQTTKGNIYFQLMSGYPIHGCTTLINRRVFEEIGLFDKNLQTTQDYDFWLRCSNKFDFYLLPETVTYSRIHNDQGTNSMTLREYERDELYTRHARHLIQDPSHKGLSQNQIFFTGKFFLKNSYLSAFFMIQRGLRSSLRIKLFVLFFSKLLVLWMPKK